VSTQFTDKFIQNHKPEAKKYYVREARGFALVVHPKGEKNPKGTKTFLYIYTFNGKRKELKLGRYPEMSLQDARVEYNKAYTLVANGTDPQAARKTVAEVKEEDLTFGHFAELYLAHIKATHAPRWVNTLKCALKKDVLPAWGDKLITTITRRDGLELLRAIAERGVQVINHHKAASGVLDYALQGEYIGANPLLGFTKKHIAALKQRTRDRHLSADEIKKAWAAIDEGPGYEETKRAMKLVLVTAQRPGEVAGMHRREIQIGEGHKRCLQCRRCGWWTIPKERNKSEREHIVYLTLTALELIGDPEGYVFPSPKEGNPIGRNAISHLISRERASKKTGGAKAQPFYGLPRFTPHDLRRTARTHMARIGVPSEHAEAVLNHSKAGLEGRYNLYTYQIEKKEALLRWEEELLKIVS
jgi:integrase